jgi:glucose-6-phosphate-specific signal transduction histidine kinase
MRRRCEHRVEITDDGRGALKAAGLDEGNGIRGLRERVAAAMGTAEADPRRSLIASLISLCRRPCNRCSAGGGVIGNRRE